MSDFYLFEVRFDLEGKERRIDELSHLSNQPDFWNDHLKAKKLSQEKSKYESEIKIVSEIETTISDIETLLELGTEEGDSASIKEAKKETQALTSKISAMELQNMLSEPEDSNNAILTINAGAGGTESQDWAEMLLRMYQKWSSAHGYQFQIIDLLPGDDAGLKNVTAMISGHNAFGFLKSEAGVHRLVRISPFDSAKRRHTSFTSVFVSPEIDDTYEVTINPADLRIDVYRSGGKGGQGVNTTDSAVRITHNPTGIVVTCQQERSQIKNKDIAMKVLKSRLYEKYLEEERAKQQKVEDTKKKIEWGSQIRSYVLHPYKMVKDHRTGASTSSADKVLNGDLDEFIRNFLKCRLSGDWALATDDDI